ncbi:MAG: hypothetical protein Q9227_004082 [Pyrenula ochraceoflavens]
MAEPTRMIESSLTEFSPKKDSSQFLATTTYALCSHLARLPPPLLEPILIEARSRSIYELRCTCHPSSFHEEVAGLLLTERIKSRLQLENPRDQASDEYPCYNCFKHCHKSHFKEVEFREPSKFSPVSDWTPDSVFTSDTETGILRTYDGLFITQRTAKDRKTKNLIQSGKVENDPARQQALEEIHLIDIQSRICATCILDRVPKDHLLEIEHYHYVDRITWCEACHGPGEGTSADKDSLPSKQCQLHRQRDDPSAMSTQTEEGLDKEDQEYLQTAKEVQKHGEQNEILDELLNDIP